MTNDSVASPTPDGSTLRALERQIAQRRLQQAWAHFQQHFKNLPEEVGEVLYYLYFEDTAPREVASWLDLDMRRVEVLRREGLDASLKLLNDGGFGFARRQVESFLRYAAAEHRAHMENKVASNIQQLRSGDLNQRVAAAETLGRLAQPEAMDHLVEALDDPAPVVRAAAARALPSFDDLDVVVPALVELLQDKSAELRGVAAEVLGRIGAEDAAVALRECFENDVPEVRAAAAEALGYLGIDVNDLPQEQSPTRFRTGIPTDARARSETQEQRPKARIYPLYIKGEGSVAAAAARVDQPRAYELKDTERGDGDLPSFKLVWERWGCVLRAKCGTETPEGRYQIALSIEWQSSFGPKRRMENLEMPLIPGRLSDSAPLQALNRFDPLANTSIQHHLVVRNVDTD